MMVFLIHYFFARGESRQINQKLVEVFYCQLAHYLSKNNSRYKLKLATALNESGLLESKEILLSISKDDIFYTESRLIWLTLIMKILLRKKLLIF